MHKGSSSVAPALWAAGTRRGTSIPLWVEAPPPEEIQKLEAASGCIAGTCEVSPALLELALIKWAAQHGESAPAPWTQTEDGGYKVPMPVVRRSEGGTLRLVGGAASLIALRSAKPANDRTFPALVLMP
jgi:hypothetical protein